MGPQPEKLSNAGDEELNLKPYYEHAGITKENTMELPTWEECETAVTNRMPNPLQKFIHENEPTGDGYKQNFRRELGELIDYLVGDREIDDGAYNVADSD